MPIQRQAQRAVRQCGDPCSTAARGRTLALPHVPADRQRRLAHRAVPPLDALRPARARSLGRVPVVRRAGDRPMTGLRPTSTRRGASCLARPDADVFTFDGDRCRAEAEARSPRQDHQPAARQSDALAPRNADGAAVWVMVNEGDGTGSPGRERPPRARRVRRPGRRAAAAGHGGRVGTARRGRDLARAVSRLLARDGLPLDQFEAVQRRIATMFNGDHVTDLRG